MKIWQWDANARIVLEGLQGKSIAALCNKYHINQSQYDQWRDQLLANASQAFKVHQDARKEVRLRGRMPVKDPCRGADLRGKQSDGGWTEPATFPACRPSQ